MKQFTILFLLALVTACAPTKNSTEMPMVKPRLEGKIVEGRYYDPKGIFNVKAKDYEEIYELPFQGDGVVGITFHSSFGQMERIEVSIDSKDKLEKQLPGSDVLSCFFEYIYDVISEVAPGTKVLEKRNIEIAEVGPICVGVFFIPKGSTMVDAITGDREDSIRSCLISYADQDLVIINVQESPSITNFRTYARNDERANEQLIENAINIRKDFKKGGSL